MTTEKLNEAFDKYKDDFSHGFHTTLWRVCVDEIVKNKIACFVSNYANGGLQLGIAVANEFGYIPSPAYFNNTKHTDAQKILMNLNKIIFDINEDAANDIICSSMFGRKKIS